MLSFVSMSSVVAALSAIFSITPAQAQQTQPLLTFVSGKGVDTGACALTAPCRTFAYAMGKTGARGEIIALDSAEYGTVTVGKPITISAPKGVEAVISVPSNQVGINVNVSSGTNVEVRGLTIDGHFVGVNGFEINGGNVSIIDCVIRNLTNTGVFQVASSTFISGTMFSKTPYAIMYRSDLNNATSFNVVNASVIRDSTNGIVVYEGTTSLSNVVFKDSNAGNIDLTTTDGSAYISNSYFNSITTGGNGYTGKIYSYGNNTIRGTVTGSLTSVSLR